MPPSFDTQPAPTKIFRVGRGDDIWAWTDLAYAGDGRWDDPQKSYSVMYASGSRFGAFLETISVFRPVLSVVAELRAVRSNARGLPATAIGGGVPANWRSQRSAGEAVPNVAAPFVAVGRSSTLARIWAELAPEAVALGIAEIDSGIIRLDCSEEFQRLTRAISRFLYAQIGPDGSRYAGIYYLGQHGDDVEDYAIFGRSSERPVEGETQGPIAADDPDFMRACSLFGLRPR